MKQRYFVALIPDEPIYHEIQAMKLQCTEKYQTHAALRSPPHITLFPPFHYNEEDEQTVSELLNTLCRQRTPFQIQLNGFGSFQNKVVFVATKQNETLTGLYQSVYQLFSKDYTIQKSLTFHPHITIAFRDWEHVVFEQARQYFSPLTYHALWNVKHMSLLKHDGSQWNEHQRFEFQKITL